MRFMMMAIPDRDGSAAPGGASGAEAVVKLTAYNTTLHRAGVLLALDGLLPPSTGARISYLDGRPTVTDDPSAESKDVIGGYWIIQVHSREEAIEWAKRAPMSDNDVIEVRQIREMSGHPEDVHSAADGFSRRTR